MQSTTGSPATDRECHDRGRATRVGTLEHRGSTFQKPGLTEALPLTMAESGESLPEISREQADILLRQIHAALGTHRAGDRSDQL